ncbi:hypothetical protein D5086_025527 [Populus alba]|uniref:Uncharacterized protein n=1 Tax=Populus alba TaxID=43335 RepID=A0ACC4B181_POPAL
MKRWFSDITLNVILKIIVSKRYVDYASPGEEKPGDEWRDSLRPFLELSGMFNIETVDDAPIDMTETGGNNNVKANTSKSPSHSRLLLPCYDLQ